MPLSELPGLGARAVAAVDNFVIPKGLGQMPALWTNPAVPICLSQAQEGGWSIGWRWHPSQMFDVALVARWLESLAWRRAKLVIHSRDGWVSVNALDNSVPDWRVSEWRRDSRIELIFGELQEVDVLQKGLAGCLLG
jgi:hypothetical protein